MRSLKDTDLEELCNNMRDVLVHAFLFLLAAIACTTSQTTVVAAFAPNSHARQSRAFHRHTPGNDGLEGFITFSGGPFPRRADYGSAVELHLFRRLLGKRGKNDDENNPEEDSGEEKMCIEDNAAKSGDSSQGEDVNVTAVEVDAIEQPAVEQPAVEVDAAVSSPIAPLATPPREIRQTGAENLLEAAQKVRLQAQKMEIELTLEKIAKLERELGGKGIDKDPDRAASIRLEIDGLKKQLSGDSKASPAVASSQPSTFVKEKVDDSMTERVEKKQPALASQAPVIEPLPNDELQERVQEYERSPKFMKEIIARTAGIDFMEVGEVNSTSLMVQLYEDEQKILNSQGGKEANEIPKFSQERIDEKVEELKNVPQFVKNFYGENSKNDTAIALQMLETEWDSDRLQRQFMQAMDKEGNEFSEKSTPDTSEKFVGSTLFGGSGNGLDRTDVENMVEALFPKSTRKEGTSPTEKQVNILMEDVLSKTKSFAASGKPEPVPGGFIIRGSNKYDDGAALIAAVDATLDKSRVKDQLQIHFIADPTPVSNEQMMVNERKPVLFVTSTDLAQDGNRILLTGVTSLAIGTAWYASLYPFLINPALLKASEEQLNLANAGMDYDLSFLTDMAVPLFFSFVAVQLAHEGAHRAVASWKKMEITFPTVIPSLLTGTTSSITSLKAPAKSKQDLFDFAIVGPLTGIILSVILVFVGCEVTATLDSAAYATLPSMPLQILRQSSLAGGVIEYVLGAGSLSVPPSAVGTAAVADINIPLHPFAIAGFLSLLVNATNLIPYGRTDGGRVSLALFGRSGAQVIGLLSSGALLVYGLFNSDLLLFFFSFVVFFQSELEIPCRNEVDDIDFSRVILSTIAGILVVLSLTPMN